MRRPPAIVIVARHGARLDAADKQWHLTSPTPYDPPLTYGGWTQSRALGARIASIVHVKEAEAARADHAQEPQAAATNGNHDLKQNHHVHKSTRSKRRKYRIIVHTSPFLRCVQTSIAISAGIGQYEGLSHHSSHPPHTKHHPMHSGSPHMHAIDGVSSPRLSAIPEPVNENDQEFHTRQPSQKRIRKSCLRVDAFLGEWLSPDYFDAITPPPGSVLMVAGAKAELLRHGEALDTAHNTTRPITRVGHFPGGWGSLGSGAMNSSDEEGALSSMSTMVHALAPKARAGSHSGSQITGNQPSPKRLSTMDVNGGSERGGYLPPTPSYAVSPSDPIPPGYVAHAREACVDVDYQWDSMRQPQDWGNGGEYGEEWSSMHKRFRRGLQSMISWYRTYDSQETLQDVGVNSTCEPEPHADEEETETILILVTHGAGCNALIGALTDQPVLMDVGMASLTMAVRKEPSNDTMNSKDSPTFTKRRHSSIHIGVYDDYDVKLIASVEHLRAGSTPLSVPQLGESPRSSPILAAYRHRFGSGFSVSSIGQLDGPVDDSQIVSLTKPGLPRRVTATPANGLWTRPTPISKEANFDEVPPPIASNGGRSRSLSNNALGAKSDGAASVASTTAVNVEESSSSESDDTLSPPGSPPGKDSTGGGLWAAKPTVVPNVREVGLKRRWTHHAVK